MGKVLQFRRQIKDGENKIAGGNESVTRPGYLNDNIVVVEKGDRMKQRDMLIRDEAEEYNKKYGNL